MADEKAFKSTFEWMDFLLQLMVAKLLHSVCVLKCVRLRQKVKKRRPVFNTGSSVLRIAQGR